LAGLSQQAERDLVVVVVFGEAQQRTAQLVAGLEGAERAADAVQSGWVFVAGDVNE
jgi:hypothetical protein